jgi:hypothetical protein
MDMGGIVNGKSGPGDQATTEPLRKIPGLGAAGDNPRLDRDLKPLGSG